MSTLILVRHGQASFGAGDYDRLSALGVAQSEALGHELAGRGLRFDRIYLGPLRRHAQTHAAVMAAYQSHGLPWPDPIHQPELDEHHGMLVMERVLPQLAEQDAALRELLRQKHAGEEAANQAYLKVFQQVTRRWARGELHVPEHEAWADFKQRVQHGLEQIREQSGGGKTVAAFTSGGVIAVAVGLALNLDDEQILALSWIVRNASYTEFLFAPGRFGLSVFNATALGDRPELLTYV
ncbi:MAG TPA: histidine phosphatase family protein [Herpetosiphonaceae bacterium]